MQTFHGVIRDSRGDACPNAPVTVYVRGTETLAEPLFAADGVTDLDNPFNSSPEGVVEFAAANGAYDIKVTTPGGVLDLDVILFDPTEEDAAQLVAIKNASGYYASSNVEDALQEVGEDLSLTGSNLTPSASWDDVPALGGDEMNAPAQALLNRTATTIRRVADAAAARAINSPTPETIFVSGRDGGIFVRDPLDKTSAEDGNGFCGTIIRGVDYAENGVWRRVLDRYIRPEMFGAKGDGVTDDTAAINAAVEAAHATGSPVSFRAVTYIVTHMYLRKGVVYEGSGRVQGYRPAIGSVIKLKNGTNPGDVGFVRKLNAYDDGFILRNLVIDGNRDNNTSGHGLEISQWDGGAVDGGSANGVGVTDCDAVVDGCYITQCAGNGIHTLADPDYQNVAAPITARNANIRNLTVKNTFVKQCNGYGLYAEQMTDSFFDRVQIANCDLGALNWFRCGSNIITNTKGYYNGRLATVGRDSYSFRFYRCGNTHLTLEAQEEYTSGVLLESCSLMSGEINTDSCGYPAYSAGWADHYRYGLGHINSNACNLIHKATSFHSDYPMGCPLRIRADGGGFTGGYYGFAIELNYSNTVDAPLIELLAGSFWGSLRIDNRTTLYTSLSARERQQIRQVIDPVNNRQWSMTGFIGSSSELLDIDQGNTSTAEKAIRLFRGTTSSFAHLDVMRGDDTATVDHQLQALSGPAYGHARFCMNGGGWDNGHVTIGAYHLWIDSSGRLRIKNSTPSSDTDGTVVGTQT